MLTKEWFSSVKHYKLVQQMSVYVNISWFSSPLPFLLDLCLSSRFCLLDIQCHVECFFTFGDRKLDSVFLKNWCRRPYDGHYALLIVMEKSRIHTSLLQGLSLFLWFFIALSCLCILLIMSTETFHAAFTTKEYQYPGPGAAAMILFPDIVWVQLCSSLLYRRTLENISVIKKLFF